MLVLISGGIFLFAISNIERNLLDANLILKMTWTTVLEVLLGCQHIFFNCSVTFKKCVLTASK